MREAHVDGLVIDHVSQRRLPKQVARKLWRQRIGVDRAAIAKYTSLKYSEYDNKAVRIGRSVVTSFEYPKALALRAPKLLTDLLAACVQRPKRNRNHVFGSSKASSSWYCLK